MLKKKRAIVKFFNKFVNKQLEAIKICFKSLEYKSIDHTGSNSIIWFNFSKSLNCKDKKWKKPILSISFPQAKDNVRICS